MSGIGTVIVIAAVMALVLSGEYEEGESNGN